MFDINQLIDSEYGSIRKIAWFLDYKDALTNGLSSNDIDELIRHIYMIEDALIGIDDLAWEEGNKEGRLEGYNDGFSDGYDEAKHEYS